MIYSWAMRVEVEKIVGGFHASDRDVMVTAFGRTREEALAGLAAARKRAERLDLLVAANSALQSKTARVKTTPS